MLFYQLFFYYKMIIYENHTHEQIPLFCTLKPNAERVMRKFPAVFIFTLFATFTQAQVTTSSISGVVKNAAGDGLTGATIIAIHEPTGTKYTEVTRSGGRFFILNMNSGGPYKVSVSFVGFVNEVKEDLQLSLGEDFKLDFAMRAAASQMSEIVVTAQRNTNRIIKNGAGTNINNRQITTLPTISRSITDFTRLTPQAGPNNTFNGRDGRFNSIQIDGANFNNNFGLSSNSLPGGDAQPISLDAIEEISVNISPYDIRQGNFTGAGINAVTRSGSNKFSGSAYSFYRNQNFNGQKVDTARLLNQESQTATFGARFGGAIKKSKLFFFVNGEVELRSFPGVNWLAARSGLSGPTVTRVRASDLDTVRSFLKQKYNYETGPYENLGNFTSNNYKLLGRIDWNINSNHKLTIRYNYVKSLSDQLLNGTSAPSPRASSDRWSQNSMAFENANWIQEDIVGSWTVELKSKLGKNFNNQFLATYTNIEANRTSNSEPFPFVDIWDGDIASGQDAYISLGYELFAWKNEVKNKVYTVTNNFSYTQGKHSITGGLSFEYLSFGNSFLRYGTSYYRYSSVSDFINGNAPIGFALTYGYNGKDPVQVLKAGQFAAYIQDEFKITDRFKLTAGLRFDLPIYFENPTANAAIATKTFQDLEGNPYVFDVGTWPKTNFLWSPRIGFNWDTEGDKSLIIRGGTGIFTGRLPFVWFTNQPGNSFALQATIEKLGSEAADYPFNPDPNHYRNSFPQSPDVLPAGASLAQVDKDFRFPQIWRSSLAMERKLPGNFVLIAEVIYTKDLNAILQYNANAAPPNGSFRGVDDRPRYTNRSAASINTDVREAMVLTNTNQGHGFSFTTQVNRNFSRGWYAQAAYSYNFTADLSNNPGSQAASAWTGLASVRGNNNLLDLGPSAFSIPHRVTGFISKRFEYFRKSLATTVSLFYQGSNQGRFTYIYSTDMNTDGVVNDLMYIPKNKKEAEAFFPATANGKEDLDAFWAYIEQDSYLKSRKGSYTEPNGALLPWNNRFDLKILQDIIVKSGNKKHTFQISADILNAGNLLNPSWGNQFRNVYASGRVLRYSGLGTGIVPQFIMNPVNEQNLKPARSFEPNPSLVSTWSMMLGIRYIF
jgi:hypothetical protein